MNVFRQIVQNWFDSTELTNDTIDNVVSTMGEKLEDAIEEYLLDHGWTFDDDQLVWVRWN